MASSSNYIELTEKPITNSAILVVDDEESLRLTFKMFLSREGYGPVSIASSYEDALEFLKKQEYDLIICDIVMQGSSGIDLLRQAKEMGLKCPIVMVTGYPNMNTAAEAVRLGAFDYLAKPVKKDNLLRTARMALQQFALYQENEQLIQEKEQYQNYLETVFTSIKDLVVTVDSEMKIVDMNKVAREWLQQHNSGAKTGDRIDELPCFSKIFALDAQTALREKVEVAEHRVEFECEEHGTRIFSISATPLLNPEKRFLGVVLVARDVSRLEALE